MMRCVCDLFHPCSNVRMLISSAVRHQLVPRSDSDYTPALPVHRPTPLLARDVTRLGREGPFVSQAFAAAQDDTSIVPCSRTVRPRVPVFGVSGAFTSMRCAHSFFLSMLDAHLFHWQIDITTRFRLSLSLSRLGLLGVTHGGLPPRVRLGEAGTATFVSARAYLPPISSAVP